MLRPCKYHTEVLALFHNYIVASETSVQSRSTVQDEVDTLNQAIKDGLAEHVGHDEYQAIPHRNEWEDEMGGGNVTSFLRAGLLSWSMITWIARSWKRSVAGSCPVDAGPPT